MNEIIFRDQNWHTHNELINKLRIIGESLPEKEMNKIERKWIPVAGKEAALASIIEFDARCPKSHDLVDFKHLHIITAYVSLAPELRIRATYDTHYNLQYYTVACKSDSGVGGLKRIEIELETIKPIFTRLLNFTEVDAKPFMGSIVIPREVWIATYRDSHTYELKCSDHGNDWQLEVEFPSEKAASSFEMPEKFAPFIDKDVTNDPYYKMKNYWARTRLGITV